MVACVPVVCGYVYLKGGAPTFPNMVRACETAPPILVTTIHEVIFNTPCAVYDDNTQDSCVICNHADVAYGYMETETRDIWVGDELLKHPNTLYNVVLHEMTHAMGLDHNNGEYGMMNYAVTLSPWWSGYAVQNDARKLWLSHDDLSGIRSLVNATGQEYCL